MYRCGSCGNTDKFRATADVYLYIDGEGKPLLEGDIRVFKREPKRCAECGSEDIQKE